MKLTQKLGLALLGVWLLLTGLLRLLGLGFPGGGLVPGLLVLVAGGALLMSGGTRNLGVLLLSLWLMLTGLSTLVALSFAGLSLILSLLSLAAGVLVLAGHCWAHRALTGHALAWRLAYHQRVDGFCHLYTALSAYASGTAGAGRGCADPRRSLT